MIGSGAVGVELGQGYARLGSAVHLVESAPRILALEEPEASASLAEALQKEGVQISVGARVSSVEASGKGVAVDRLQDRVVVHGRVDQRPRRDGRPGHDRDDVPPLGRAAASRLVLALALVERDEQNTARAELVEEARHPRRDELVPRRHRTVVHVLTQVRSRSWYATPISAVGR